MHEAIEGSGRLGVLDASPPRGAAVAASRCCFCWMMGSPRFACPKQSVLTTHIGQKEKEEMPPMLPTALMLGGVAALVVASLKAIDGKRLLSGV